MATALLRPDRPAEALVVESEADEVDLEEGIPQLATTYPIRLLLVPPQGGTPLGCQEASDSLPLS